MEKVIILNATELGYQVIRSLGIEGIRSIVIYDKEKDEIGRYSKYVVESIKIPGFIEKPELLIDFLMERKKEWAGMLILPTKDYTVEIIAKYKEILSVHYIIPTPDFDTVRQIVNKKPLYDTAQKLGISIPRIFTPKSLAELASLKNEITFPCLLKPGLGHLFFRKFDFKMLEIADFNILVSHYKDLTSNFTKDEYELMICEIIPGPDSKQMVQYVSYIDQSGELLTSMTSIKMRQDPPKYGQGRVIKSKKINDLDEISHRLLRELGYYGFCEVEWKFDRRDGKYKLIEINPRYIFYIGLCRACGINFPYIQYLDFVKHRKLKINSYKENVYWIHLYKDVLHTVLHHRMEEFGLLEYASPYFSKKSYAVLNWRDPLPFYYQWKQHLGEMLKMRKRMAKG
jgi:predicted ATP-grasp superfamily ATP-dependent carboligase